MHREKATVVDREDNAARTVGDDLRRGGIRFGRKGKPSRPVKQKVSRRRQHDDDYDDDYEDEEPMPRKGKGKG
ncbi:hypothetical protein MJI37_01555, partial [Salmonella enterica subsp. enterica serovar Cerro]|nr:hypothetical protein [Salmonella enterica subsp. enterica serovar Cerro]